MILPGNPGGCRGSPVHLARCCAAKADRPRADRTHPTRPVLSRALSQPFRTPRARLPNDHRHRPGAARRFPDPAVRRHPAGAAGRPDRSGRPQRRRQDHHAEGAGRRGQPYAGQIDRRGAVGYLPQDPRTGDLEVTARDRVLSARGLDALLAEMQELEAELAEDADDEAGPPLRRAGGPVRRARRVRRRGRGGPDLRQPRPARPGARPDHRHPVRRSAPPHRAGPDPVPRRRRDRRRHPAAGRADQPPRRRLDHLAARLPRPATRAASS